MAYGLSLVLIWTALLAGNVLASNDAFAAQSTSHASHSDAAHSVKHEGGISGAANSVHHHHGVQDAEPSRHHPAKEDCLASCLEKAMTADLVAATTPQPHAGKDLPVLYHAADLAVPQRDAHSPSSAWPTAPPGIFSASAKDRLLRANARLRI